MPENQAIIQCNIDDNMKNENSDTNNNDVCVMNDECLLNGTVKNYCSNGIKSKGFKPVTHVIFDLDGLLINSEVCFANAIRILLKRFGKFICFVE
ncbi:hypothetical protein BLA29_014262 [Euroglyphus maynei]|uniref:Uncharacterized protein n=1 Tax=Euroglyphus maynei TaxID=6958 RepID=A0A1Y3BVM0_EURMA|nr:hypothetical protein BLA29_014262 [Euroglyphus maynei]